MAKGKNSKKVKYDNFDNNGKKTIQSTDPNSYDTRFASWGFSKRALNSKWAISRNDWKLWENEILPGLKDHEGMTWAQIKNAQKNGKSSSKNHNISVGDLISEAQKELNKIFRKQYDEIFSLRIGGTKRIYGFLEKGVLYIVWYDDKHEICPCEK